MYAVVLLQMRALEAEVEQKKALLQQLKTENEVLTAKARLLEEMVTCGDVTLDMMIQPLQDLQISDGPTEDVALPSTQQDGASTQDASPAQHAARIICSNAMPNVDHTAAGREPVSGFKSFRSLLSDTKELVRGYIEAAGMTSSPVDMKTLCSMPRHDVVVLVRNIYRGVVSTLSALLLQLDRNPHDPEIIVQIQSTMRKFWFRTLPLRTFCRVPISYLKATNLETLQTQQAPPPGHWDRVSQMLSYK